MQAWDAVIARARGLSTHLLSPRELTDLARAGDLHALARRLPRELQAHPAPTELEARAHRAAALRLATLRRHAGTRRALALAALDEDEERRAVRRLLRAAMQGVPRATRLAGLLPTPLLSRTALERLAQTPDAHAVATALVALGHPYGLAVLELTRSVQPDPLALELALDAEYATRATRAARRGDSVLRRHIAREIDFDDAVAAIAQATSDGDAAREHVLATVGDEVVVHALRDAMDPRGAFLRAQIAALERERRIAPLSTAPVIWFVLRARQEQMKLQRIIWGVALDAPAEVIG